MQVLVLNNKMEYAVISCGASDTQINITVAAEGNDLGELCTVFSNKENTKRMQLFNESGEKVRSDYENYSKFVKVEMRETSNYDKENDKNVTVKVYDIVLKVDAPEYATEDALTEKYDILAGAVEELAAMIAEM